MFGRSFQSALTLYDRCEPLSAMCTLQSIASYFDIPKSDESTPTSIIPITSQEKGAWHLLSALCNMQLERKSDALQNVTNAYTIFSNNSNSDENTSSSCHIFWCSHLMSYLQKQITENECSLLLSEKCTEFIEHNITTTTTTVSILSSAVEIYGLYGILWFALSLLQTQKRYTDAIDLAKRTLRTVDDIIARTNNNNNSVSPNYTSSSILGLGLLSLQNIYTLLGFIGLCQISEEEHIFTLLEDISHFLKKSLSLCSVSFTTQWVYYQYLLYTTPTTSPSSAPPQQTLLLQYIQERIRTQEDYLQQSIGGAAYARNGRSTCLLFHWVCAAADVLSNETHTLHAAYSLLDTYITTYRDIFHTQDDSLRILHFAKSLLLALKENKCEDALHFVLVPPLSSSSSSSSPLLEKATHQSSLHCVEGTTRDTNEQLLRLPMMPLLLQYSNITTTTKKRRFNSKSLLRILCPFLKQTEEDTNDNDNNDVAYVRSLVIRHSAREYIHATNVSTFLDSLIKNVLKDKPLNPHQAMIDAIESNAV